MDANTAATDEPGGYKSVWHRLRGVLVAQAFGQFNDQAWKQLVILLAMAAVVGEARQWDRRRIAQIAMMIPLTVFRCRRACSPTG